MAALTAWNQYGPKNDKISLIDEGRIDVGMPLKILPAGAMDPKTGKNQPVFGPVTWKFRVHNASDRSVALVSFKAFMLSEDGGLIKYSEMRERFSSYDAALPIQVLPENIPANESRAYLVSLFVPYRADEDEGSPCGKSGARISDFEGCFYDKGRDLFENKVEKVYFDSDSFLVRWGSGVRAPRFSVVVETADGSRFSVILPYFPHF